MNGVGKALTIRLEIVRRALTEIRSRLIGQSRGVSPQFKIRTSASRILQNPFMSLYYFKETKKSYNGRRNQRTNKDRHISKNLLQSRGLARVTSYSIDGSYKRSLDPNYLLLLPTTTSHCIISVYLT